MKGRQFFAELKRRNVYKVAVVAWLLIQLASILFLAFQAPPCVMKVFITTVLLGLPIALILAWAFELAPTSETNQGAVEDPAQLGRLLPFLRVDHKEDGIP